VSPKRRDRVAPPSIDDEWNVRFATSEAAKGWDDLCTQATGNTRDAFELMRSNPRPPEDGRHTRLRGGLATNEFDGRTLEQWEIEVTGSGRILYLVDDDKHTVWVVYASMRHPKKTERRSGRK
jgi:mRNA-degrading endonuclease RelE of RelBE toxin-antitoxin system